MLCDLCDSSEYEALFETSLPVGERTEIFSVVRCAICRLVRTEPQPPDLSLYYPEDEYYSFATPRAPSVHERRRLRRFYGEPAHRPRLRRSVTGIGTARLSPGLPPGPPGDILDVGCGSGKMLLALESAGWRCHGVEISPAAVQAAREAGLADVRSGSLTEVGYPTNSFDVVRFWHSLEHLRSPRAYLTEANRLLRTGGSLVVGVPNFSSFLSRVARDKWYYLDVPRHLWHFEPATLSRLAVSCGFEGIRMRLASTSTPILGTIENRLGFEGTLRENRFLWKAMLPLAIATDWARLGDGLELLATIGPRHKASA